MLSTGLHFASESTGVQEELMTIREIFGAAIVGVVVSGSVSTAETLIAHRLPSVRPHILVR
jgi:hypothetical protein